MTNDDPSNQGATSPTNSEAVRSSALLGDAAQEPRSARTSDAARSGVGGECGYATGQTPMKGDHVRYANQDREYKFSNREARELWIVTSICDDMIRAKCDGAESWRQAFFTAQMQLVSRKGVEPGANNETRESKSGARSPSDRI